MSDFPQGWSSEKLGDIADIRVSNVDKKTISSEVPVRLCNYMDVYSRDYINATDEFMSASATTSEVKRFALREGDVVITKDSESPDDIGIPALIETTSDDLVCGYHLAILRPSARLDSSWLAKQLGHERAKRYFAKVATGSTRYGLSNSSINNFEVWLPSVDEQRSAIQVLRTLDDAIQKTEQLINKLKQIKQGLLHDLLTRGIEENGQLRDPIAHPEQFKDSVLGRIPSSWNPGRLDALVYIHDGKRIPLKQSDRDNMKGAYPYYGASGIIDYISNYIFDGEYILLGEDGENVVSRNLPLAFRASGKFWVNNHAHVFEPKDGVDIRYLEELMEFTDYSRIVLGSAQPKITQEGLSRLWFAIPPSEEQSRIADVLATHTKRVSEERNHLAKLTRLKKVLMTDLLTGRVRVRIGA